MSTVLVSDAIRHLASRVEVSAEVHDLDPHAVLPGRDDGVALVVLQVAYAVLVDAARVDRVAVTAEGLTHPVAGVDERRRRVSEIDRDDDVKQRRLRALGLEPRDAILGFLERCVHHLAVDPRPTPHHLELVVERVKAAMDETKDLVLAHGGDHDIQDVLVANDLPHVLGGESRLRENAHELNVLTELDLMQAGHVANLLIAPSADPTS